MKKNKNFNKPIDFYYVVRDYQNKAVGFSKDQDCNFHNVDEYIAIDNFESSLLIQNRYYLHMGNGIS